MPKTKDLICELSVMFLFVITIADYIWSDLINTTSGARLSIDRAVGGYIDLSWLNWRVTQNELELLFNPLPLHITGAILLGLSAFAINHPIKLIIWPDHKSFVHRVSDFLEAVGTLLKKLIDTAEQEGVSVLPGNLKFSDSACRLVKVSFKI